MQDLQGMWNSHKNSTQAPSHTDDCNPLVIIINERQAGKSSRKQKKNAVMICSLSLQLGD